MPISVTCPACSHGFTVSDSSAARRIKCPRCRTEVGVPRHPVPERLLKTVPPEEEEWTPRPRRPYRESVWLRILTALLILVGLIFTIGGLTLQTSTYFTPVGMGPGMAPFYDPSLMSEKQLRVLGGLAAIGLGILLKMLAVLQAYVALEKQRD